MHELPASPVAVVEADRANTSLHSTTSNRPLGRRGLVVQDAAGSVQIDL